MLLEQKVARFIYGERESRLGKIIAPTNVFFNNQQHEFNF